MQFLGPCLEPGLFGAGALLLCLQLLLRRFQLLLQPGLRLLVLCQLGFQFAAVLANHARLPLGAFPTPDLFGQRFGQSLDLLLHLRLRRL